MRPTEILSQEHRIIEQVLDCLEKIGQQCLTEGRLDGDAARQAVKFFRGFADRCHHGKEEDHLFPAMEANGFPREHGPTGVMLHEHEQGREAIRQMAGSIDSAEAGDGLALRQFVRHAQAYIGLLREHIQKEDHCLFPMADQALSQSEHEDLMDRFGKVESKLEDGHAHEKFIDIANSLARQYGVATTATSGSSCKCHTGSK